MDPKKKVLHLNVAQWSSHLDFYVPLNADNVRTSEFAVYDPGEQVCAFQDTFQALEKPQLITSLKIL